MKQCTECGGKGSVPTAEFYRGRTWTISIPCHRCRETGMVESPVERATIIQFPARPSAKIIQLPLPAGSAS